MKTNVRGVDELGISIREIAMNHLPKIHIIGCVVRELIIQVVVEPLFFRVKLTVPDVLEFESGVPLVGLVLVDDEAKLTDRVEFLGHPVVGSAVELGSNVQF